MMIKKHFLSFYFISALVAASTTAAEAQTVIGMGTDQPNPNAVLELVPENGNQGFLAPRLTTSQRQASSFTGKLGSADHGLLVFDTNEGKFFYWFRGEWRAGTPGESTGADPGVAGTTWYTGTTAPSRTDVTEGDFYINESTGEVFRFSGNTFVVIGSLAGAPASTPDLATVLEKGGSAGNRKISQLGGPTDNDDAATKKYVDDRETATRTYIDSEVSDIVLTAQPTPGLGTVLGVNSDANRRITNLSTPTSPNDAATKAYVDNNDADNQSLADVLDEGNDANENKIIGLKDPDDPQDAATKNYVDTNAKITEFSVSGGNLKLTEGGNSVTVSLGGGTPTTLNEGDFFIGNGDDEPIPVTITGHITIDGSGVATITDAVVTTAKIANGAVTMEKINANVAGSGLAKNSSTAPLEVKAGNGLAIDSNDGSLRLRNPQAGYLGIGQGTGNNDYIQFVPISGDATLAQDGTLKIIGLRGQPLPDPSDGQVLQWKNNQWEWATVPGVGSDTPVITTGTDEPDDGDGKLGDIYVDTNDNKAYVKIVGEWKKL